MFWLLLFEVLCFVILNFIYNYNLKIIMSTKWRVHSGRIELEEKWNVKLEEKTEFCCLAK